MQLSSTQKCGQTTQDVLLCIGLLHQGAPELIAIIGVTVDEVSINCGQPVINHHVHPLSKTPESEVENPSIWFVFFPLLVLPVRNHL